MSNVQQTTASVIVGLLWGLTNPLIKRGSEAVERSKKQGQHWLLAHLSPQFLIPLLANQSGSALFIWLLGKGEIGSVVPQANGFSLIFTALADLALGERYNLAWLIPGLLLVASGVLLCG
jgi:hypothetical protein